MGDFSFLFRDFHIFRGANDNIICDRKLGVADFFIFLDNFSIILVERVDA